MQKPTAERKRPIQLAAATLCTLLLGGPAGAEPSTATTAAAPSHHVPGGFRNPYPVDEQERGFFAYWRMRLFGEPFADQAAEAHLVPRRSVDPATLVEPAEAPRATWIGHATFLVEYGETRLLTDPHFSERASPFSFAGPRRLVPLPITLEDLPPVDYVVISHSHYDQLDEATVRALGDGPIWLVPLGLERLLTKWGVDPERVVELDWWERHDAGGAAFTATPAHHWSARSLFDRNETLWSSWRVEIGDFRLWFGGDTAYNPVQFKEIGERLGPVDLALIPIGAYAPRWFMRNAHVTPEEALQIHRDIGSLRSIGMHWGTFQLTAEPILEPAERLRAAVAAAGPGVAPFDTLAIGETLVLAPRRPVLQDGRFRATAPTP